jgi:hypothetical protein
MIKRSGDVVCGLHRAQGDKECRFLGLASKPLGRLSWFGLKTRVNGLSMVWLQNHLDRFPSLGLKIGSYSLSLKITLTVSWFGPQNHVGYGLLVAPQNRW